jgi:putative ABC transport system substrate-binding protein
MRRREFIKIVAGSAATWPFVARAQQNATPMIGILWPGAEPPAPPRMESFRQALRQLGFVEGKNVAIELRYARRGLQQLPELADELVRMKADLLLTFGDLTPKIAQQATKTIPIVAISDDIVIVAAFRAARNDHADAINVFSSPFLSSLFREIIVLSAEYRLPAIYQWKEHVEAGGLVSFGPNLAAMYRQTATIVVKILTGAKPSELPVEQPTKFELAVNGRTAQALGLGIPPSILVRADDVIE